MGYSSRNTQTLRDWNPESKFPNDKEEEEEESVIHSEESKTQYSEYCLG